jgi:Zinc carboxypeptidase
VIPSRTASFGLALAAWIGFSGVASPIFPAADTPEPGSGKRIAEVTTDPRYLSPWVSYVPDSKTVPSPTKFLGRIVGEPGELSRLSQIHGYFRELARTSSRVHVEVIGKTEEGRDILLAAIADEPGIRNLSLLKKATAALADPRRTSPAEAERIIAGARPIYYINAALHADEDGSPEMCMELAYRLAVSDLPMIREIRRKVVVLINPVSEPDGHEKMVDWFYKYLKGRTDYDSLPRQSPPYWGHYVYVDINRDAHQQAMAVTRAVFRMFFDYHPTVIHDLHEAIALLQTWNGTGPYNPHLDPIVTSQFLEMSFHEVRTLTALGMPGVWTWNFGENFGLHYLDSIALNHNSVGRGYETFGNATAETVQRTIWEDETSREWYRPWPPDRSFKWSMRDNINYQETACLSILDYTAAHAGDMLRNFYRTGFKSWQAGLTGHPLAYVIPEEQGDRKRVADLVNRLLAQGIEVGRAAEPVVVNEGIFPPGSYVVRLDQPYRNYAVDLLEPQKFPADSADLPYDDVSWALPVHYGIEARSVDDPRIHQASLQPLTGPVHPVGRVDGTGPVFLIKDTGQEALLAARFRLAGFAVQIAEDSFPVAGTDYPAGSWILEAQDGLEPAIRKTASELGLDFESALSVPEVRRHDAGVPRLGVYVPWADTDSIGWIRYVLDRERIPYVYLRDEDIREGKLLEKVDVILYGDVRLDLQGQIHGIAPISGPMPFQASPEFPNLGAPVASEDITGGLGWSGLASLQQFLNEGGLLITLGNASTLALEGGLVRNVRRARDQGVQTHGVELKVKFMSPGHPISYGYPPASSAFRSDYAVYDLPRRWLEMAYCTSCLDGPVDKRGVVLQWGTRVMGEVEEAGAGGSQNEGSGSMVVSGGVRGAEKLEGRPAILDLPAGKGKVIAFNFNPLHRDLNHSDARFLWNVLLNWKKILS